MLDETNVGIDSVYKLNLIGFASSKSACTPNIEAYSVSSSGTVQDTAADSYAAIDPLYAGGASNFEVVLQTAALGTYDFYIWGKDHETRWDELAVSTMVRVIVSCGSEEITTTDTELAFVFSLNGGGQSIDFQTDVVPKFVSSKS